MGQILAVGLSATIQKTIAFGSLQKHSVNRSSGYRLDASGKAVNAARVLHQLEAGCVSAVCPLGSGNAALFLELAASDGLPVLSVPTPGRVRYCYTLLEEGSLEATELVVGEPTGAGDFQSVTDSFLSLLAGRLGRLDVAFLLLAGSRPDQYPSDVYPRICALAGKAGIPVMADFHGKDLLRVLEGYTPAVIKINEIEYCGTFGAGFPPEEAVLIRHLERTSAELGATVVVTRGSRDVLAASGGVSIRLPVRPLPAVNTIGSGDAFNAGFLHSWLKDGRLAAALEQGIACASRNVLNLRPGSILDASAQSEQLLR